MDNCEQLRLMQDVAIVEELPEIRDSIEYCENMIDTLQEELNGLRGMFVTLTLTLKLIISLLKSPIQTTSGKVQLLRMISSSL